MPSMRRQDMSMKGTAKKRLDDNDDDEPSSTCRCDICWPCQMLSGTANGDSYTHEFKARDR